MRKHGDKMTLTMAPVARPHAAAAAAAAAAAQCDAVLPAAVITTVLR